MYQVYIERETSFSPELVGEYEDLEAAQEKAKQEKTADPSIYYTIEATNGGFNNYGELLTSVVEKG